jgi:hypothetical protein
LNRHTRYRPRRPARGGVPPPMPSDSRPRRSRSLVWAPSPCPSPPPRLMGCVVRFVATRASRGLGVDWRGLGVVWRARVGGWVGFEGVRFVRFVCLSRVCPGSPRCLFTGTQKRFPHSCPLHARGRRSTSSLDSPQDWSLLLLCDAERFGGMAACVAARILRHHRNRRWLQWEERKLQHP